MDLFGKRALSDLQSRCDKAIRGREKAEAALAEERRHAESETSARQAAEEQFENMRVQLAELEKDLERVRESQLRAEQMVHWMEERESGNRGKVQKAETDQEAANRKASEARTEIDSLRSELEALRVKPAKAPEPAAREPEPKEETGSVGPIEALRSENEALRRERAEITERLRVAARKAEHNRRAYLVTQMQLDLAEDRIHLLTKGKPRPVHRVDAGRDVSPDEKVVAEDVEEFEESEPAGG